MKVEIVENILKMNDQIAAENRRVFKAAGVLVIDLLGSPGCGKTSLLEATLDKLAGRLRVGVMAGDLATARDGQRLARHCAQVVQINTGKTCHLEAFHVQQALSRLTIAQLDVLFIENVGNLICPVGFDLGQDIKVGMFSVTEGDDKPAKHPYVVQESDLLILNKRDLLPYVRFDATVFQDDIRRLKPDARVLEMSVSTGQGLDQWLDWLTAQRMAFAG